MRLEDAATGACVGFLAWIAAIWFACLEIEIEGDLPWARGNCHTWKVLYELCGQKGVGACGSRDHKEEGKTKITIGLPLTGYHLTMFTTLFLVATCSVVVTHVLSQRSSPSMSSVCFASFFYALVVALEDSAWYSLNYLTKRSAFDAEGGACVVRLKRYAIIFVVVTATYVASEAFLSFERGTAFVSDALPKSVATYAGLLASLVLLIPFEKWLIAPFLYEPLRRRLVASTRVPAGDRQDCAPKSGEVPLLVPCTALPSLRMSA